MARCLDALLPTMPPFLPPSFAPGQVLTTCKLGLGQMLSWGSAFYLPAILAGAMGESLGIPPSRIFAAFEYVTNPHSNHRELPATSVHTLATQPPVQDSAVAKRRPAASSFCPTRSDKANSS